MRTIKMKGQVERDHSLHLQLPDDIEEGPAEVIVLVEQAAEAPRAGSLAEILSDPQIDPRFVRSKEAIDRDLQAERDSWG